MIACLRWELAKLRARKRSLLLLGLLNLLPLLALFLLLLSMPFDLGWRQKLVIPAVTGLVGMGLSFAQYLYPASLAVLAAGCLAGEEGEGSMRTAFLCFRPRWQIIASRLLALSLVAFMAVCLSGLLFALAMFCAWLKLSPLWWQAFDFPLRETFLAFLGWLPWFMVSQLALVGFLGTVNVFCRSTHGAVALSLAVLAAFGVASVVLPDLALRLGLSAQPERWLFTWHYGAPMDPDVIQRLVLGQLVEAPRQTERLRWILGEGLLFWSFTLWAYGRRDMTN